MSKHTPLPWKAASRGYGGTGMVIRSAGACPPDAPVYYQTVATTIQRDEHLCHGGGISQVEAEANADLIVRAVNCHNALLEAVKLAVNAVVTVHGEYYELPRDVLKELHAAVAKAEGRS